MKLWTSAALLCTLALASSASVRAEDMGDGDVGDSYTWYENSTYTNTTTSGNSTTNSTTNSSASDVPSGGGGGGGGGGGVPAPSGARAITWQATVVSIAAAAVAIALV